MILIDTQKEEFSKLKDIRVFGKISHENRFNGDLLVIGLGGVGRQVLCALKGMLSDKITAEDNISFLYVDSSIPEMELTIEDSKENIGLNALEVISIYRPNLENILADGIKNNPVHPNLANWMDPEFPDISIGTDGAKGNRQIGRLMFSNAYEDIRVLLFDKLEELHDRVSGDTLDVIVITGVAGGTGSGILTDLTYNIRAYAKAKKWNNVRVGGCLLMPDVLYGNKAVASDPELVYRLNANGCATMKEVDYLMKLSEKNDVYTYESTTHRMSIRDNLFDACMLVSGKKDEQGYIPEGFIFQNTANFLYKLSCNKYIGNNDVDTSKKLLRDVFFDSSDKEVTSWKMDADEVIKSSNCYYKVVSESDYIIPVKAMENISESEFFTKAYKKLFVPPFSDEQIAADIADALGDLKKFLEEAPGDQISLNVSGLINFNQFERPVYKMIKKGQDNLRENMGKKLEAVDKEIPVMIKSIKNKLWSSLDSIISRYLRMYGPFAAIDVIGAPGVGMTDSSKGMVAEINKLAEIHRNYTPTGEFERIIDSIKAIVAKRFFTFPSAKRETEAGYYDACVKETLEAERTRLMDGINSADLFGDTVRWLKQRAEHLDEIYSQFGEDLKNAVEDLASEGKATVGSVLKDAPYHDFLPEDFITEKRVNLFKEGLINLMLNNESNIDNGRVVPVKDEMEKIYREMFSGIGAFGPEKMMTVAFSPKKINEQDLNVMFGSPNNDRREDILSKAAAAFVREIKEEQELCVMNADIKSKLISRKYISVPNMMPYFSKAVKQLLISEPYNEKEDSITLNPGEIEISIDTMFVGVPLCAMECSEDMQKAYNSVTGYKGLHVDEMNRDMRNYPDIVSIA